MPASRLLVTAVLVAATACGGGAKPSTQPTPAPTTPSPTPTPTLPPVATDQAAVKAAIVTSADLGAPWVTPKKVNRTQTAKGELCPGKQNEQKRVPPRATGSVQMTEGAKEGAAIASFDVHAFDPVKVEPYALAFVAATADCKAYTALEKTYVTTEDVPGVTVPGTDEAMARIERIYADSSKKQLYYVRQTIKARVGRAYVALEHAFIQPKTDPTGADFTKTIALLTKQVDKLAAHPIV